MAEFVDGYEKLARIGPCVAIFGSARSKPDNKYYRLAEEIAYLLTKKASASSPVADRALWKRVTKGGHILPEEKVLA